MYAGDHECGDQVVVYDKENAFHRMVDNNDAFQDKNGVLGMHAGAVFPPTYPGAFCPETLIAG